MTQGVRRTLAASLVTALFVVPAVSAAPVARAEAPSHSLSIGAHVSGWLHQLLAFVSFDVAPAPPPPQPTSGMAVDPDG